MSILVFWVTLFIATPCTTRSLRSEPRELNDDECPFACVLATPRTALAFTRPFRMLTLAVSAVLVWTAAAGEAVTVLLAALRTTSARRTDPSDGTLAFSSSFCALFEPTPDWLLDDAASVWLSPSNGSFTPAPNPPPLACARSGRSIAKLTGSAAVRSWSEEVMEVDERVFMCTVENSAQPIAPIVSERFSAASPNAPGATPGIVLGMLTAPSQRAPWLPSASSTKLPLTASPCHLNARTAIVLPPLSVSNAIRTSPGVRFGSAGQAGFGAVDWLNS